MTKKYDDFMSELKALCEKHQVSISTIDYGRGDMTVWALVEDGDVIQTGEITDMTGKFGVSNG